VEGAEHGFRQQFIFGFVPQGELVHHVRTEALPAEWERLPEILAAWERVQPRIQTLLRREANQVGAAAAPLPAEFEAHAARVLEDPLFQKTLWKLPIRLGMVEIDRLVAAQRHVNLEYVEALAAGYPARPSPRELVDICLDPGPPVAPAQHMEIAPNTHVFSSPNSDLRFLGSYLRPLRPEDAEHAEGGGRPVAMLVAFVGYGTAPVNVYEAGGRLILANGFHRLCALRRLGVRQVPVVVQVARNPALEVPALVTQLPREYLLGAQRPVLMRDFFEPEFSVELRIRRRLKMVLVSHNLGQHEVPY
jgi:hypothetical protein